MSKQEFVVQSKPLEWLELYTDNIVQRIPFRSLESIDKTTIEYHCKNVLRDWVRHCRSQNKYDVDTFKKLSSMTKVCFYNRIVDSADDCMNHHCDSYISAESRMTADEYGGDVIFAVFCIEEIRDRRNNSIAFERVRIYFMGFIKADSPAIALGPVAEIGSIIYNCELKNDHTRVQQRFLTFDVDRIVSENVAESTLDDIGISNINLSNKEPDIQTVEIVDVDTSKGNDESDIQTVRNNPTVWIYIYHNDNPSRNNSDVNFIAKMDLESSVRKRLDMLSNTHMGAFTQDHDTTSLQLKMMPISNRTHMIRDRMCMHFLLAAMSMDDELLDWYIDAETKVLENNLKMLADIEDKILTLRNNDIDVKELIKSKKIDIWNSYNSVLCWIHRTNMVKAAEEAKKHVISMAKKHKKRLNKKNDIQKDGYDDRPDELILELIQNCRLIAAKKVRFEKSNDESASSCGEDSSDSDNED